MIHTIKKGDTKRKFTDTLTLGGLPVDLTGATVQLLFKSGQTGVVVSRTATVVSAAAGTVEYQPIDADVAEAGAYLLLWKVTFPGSLYLHWPSDGYIRLNIEPNFT